MKRINLMFLAVVGALALTASAGASVASASGISFGSYPAAAKGQDFGNHGFYFTAGRSLGCGFKSMTAEATGPSETLTATVVPTQCSSEFEGNVSIAMNGCKFIYHPNVGKGTLDLGPSSCGGITLEGAFCTRHFAPQTGLGASFSNEGTPSTVKIADEALGLQYTILKGGKAYCGSGTQSANFLGNWTLKGYNEGGTQIDARVVPGTGLFLTGEKSGEASKQPKVAAEGYPVSITGSQDPTAKFALTVGGNRKVECEAVASHSSESGAGAALGLGMEYSGCNLTILENVFPAEIVTNSCELVLHALNAGPPYAGSIDVACAKEGDAIELKDYSAGSLVCTYKVAPQSGFEGVGLTNIGSGTDRAISASFGLSGLTVTRVTGTLAACGGASQKATYSGTTTLRGIQ
jgi:hypothetical protein